MWFIFPRIAGLSHSPTARKGAISCRKGRCSPGPVSPPTPYATLIHAFLPFLFDTTGRDTISELHERMVTHRRVQPVGRLAAVIKQ